MDSWTLDTPRPHQLPARHLCSTAHLDGVQSVQSVQTVQLIDSYREIGLDSHWTPLDRRPDRLRPFGRVCGRSAASSGGRRGRGPLLPAPRATGTVQSARLPLGHRGRASFQVPVSVQRALKASRRSQAVRLNWRHRRAPRRTGAAKAGVADRRAHACRPSSRTRSLAGAAIRRAPASATRAAA
jgi:hypothetical protein